jgi:hypothetical protein
LAGSGGIEEFRRNRRRQIADEICCPDCHWKAGWSQGCKKQDI